MVSRTVIHSSEEALWCQELSSTHQRRHFWCQELSSTHQMRHFDVRNHHPLIRGSTMLSGAIIHLSKKTLWCQEPSSTYKRKPYGIKNYQSFIIVGTMVSKTIIHSPEEALWFQELSSTHQRKPLHSFSTRSKCFRILDNSHFNFPSWFNPYLKGNVVHIFTKLLLRVMQLNKTEI